MTPLNESNNGDHPSRLQLGRLHTNELDAAEARAVQQNMHDEGQQYLAELEAIKASTPALGIAGLRAAAAQATDPTIVVPPQANNWTMFAPLLLLAAVLTLAVLPTLLDPGLSTTEHGGGSTTLKADGAELMVYQLHSDDALRAYDGDALGAGDTLGFRVNGGTHRSLVLMSVDGRGVSTVFYPSEGQTPLSLEGTSETTPLPGTIVLDGAPGPEIFVAVFDQSVAEARTELDAAYQTGGAGAVISWASSAENVDAVSVERR